MTTPGEPRLAELSERIARYERTADPADFTAAIATGDRLLTACRQDPASEIGVLLQINGVLGYYCHNTGDIDALAQIVANGRRALDLAQAGEFDGTWLAGLRALLARSLLFWYESSGDVESLTESVALCRAAVAAATAVDPAQARAALARALRLLHERTGDPALLDEGIGCLRAAPLTAEIRAALARSLQDRYRLYGQVTDLDEAVRVLRGGLQDASARSVLRGLLAGILILRYAHDRELSGLAEAIGLLRADLAATPEAGYDRPELLATLGIALATRYEAAGGPDDIAESLRLLRAAVSGVPAGDRNRAGYLNSLGNTLLEWHTRTQDPETLAEAIAVLREARDQTPDDSPARVLHTATLVGAMLNTASPGQDDALLDEAIALIRQTLADSPPGNVGLPALRNNLATALLRRAALHTETGAALADCGEAAASLETALAGLGEGHARRVPMLCNLALARYMRYSGTNDEADLADALETARQALGDGQRGSADVNAAIVFGGIARDACRRRADDSLRRRALAALRTVTADEAAAPHLRASALQVTGDLLIGNPAEALEAYASAVVLLPQVAPRNLQRSASERLLSNLTGLASDAAACALMAGEPARAVSFLELGRGVLLTNVLDARAGTAELRAVSPSLAHEFNELRDALDPAADGSGELTTTAEASRAAQRRRQLAARWPELLAEIRRLPGLGGFLEPPSPEELLQETGEGSVVLINVSQYRCDALLLTSGGLQVVPLPRLSAEAVTEQAAVLTAATARSGLLRLGTPGREQPEAEITRILHWLWDAAAAPVLEALGITGPPPQGQSAPRVWWSATGLLGQLPLHAAGKHDEDSGETVLDRVVPSLTPTVRALRHSRRLPRAADPDVAGGSVLVVALPQTPDAAALPGATAEAAMLMARFPGSRLLTGPEATRPAVLAALATTGLAHFACHARNDPADPAASGLLLHDHGERLLNIRDISALDLPAARLAYLSACETTRASRNLADEAVHITGAFQLAGFPEVIGTLWNIEDEAALDIATSVYAAAVDGEASGAVSAALRDAVLRLRSRSRAAPSLWAGFVHIGR